MSDKEVDNTEAIIIDNNLNESYNLSKVELKYPLVKLNNTLVEYKINQKIIDLVNNTIKIQYTEYEDIEFMSGGYSVQLNDIGVLSLLFDNFIFSKGDIHGIAILKSLNINLKNGKIYKFDGLFDKNVDFKERINFIIKNIIKEEKIYLLREFKSINENQDFYLTNSSLVVYFQLYEYTPYSYGFLKISIPYEEIKDIINPKGPIPKIYK